MFVLALKGKETEGAYAVENEFGQKTLYLFVDKDDAMRYSLLLEADDYPEMSIVEVSDEDAIGTCHQHGYPYYVVTPDQIVIPPDF